MLGGMNNRTEQKARHPRRRPAPRTLVATALAIASVAALGIAWWLGLLSAEPAAVALDETVAELSSANEDAVGAETTSTAATYAQDTTEAAPTEASSNALGGEWSVVSGDATYVGYRADSRVGEAVGRSPGVTGTLTATESQITAVEIVADMTQLESDSSLRDSHLGDEGLEYNTYPTSTFVLTEPIDIPVIPDEGTVSTFSAVGELTVRDIANPVTVALEATIVNGQLVVVGSTDLALDDYGASVSSTDSATMEFSIVFAP